MTGADSGAAARWIRAAEARLGALGRGLLDGLIPPGGLRPGEHYPESDVWDPGSHAQWFFHAHDEAGRFPGEIGHFHTFLGQAGMCAGVAPLVLPEMAFAPEAAGGEAAGPHRSRRDRGIFSHLIGVSVDGAGRPLGLFTTNRWVTGETWYRAGDVIRMLDGFYFTDPQTLLDSWLAAILLLFRTDLIRLIEERDRAIMEWRQRRGHHRHVFDDRRLVMPSAGAVDFAAALARHDPA